MTRSLTPQHKVNTQQHGNYFNELDFTLIVFKATNVAIHNSNDRFLSEIKINMKKG